MKLEAVCSIRRSSERSRMSAWVEFGFRRRRIRKSKASPDEHRGAESPQTTRDRRRVLRTEFEPLGTET